VHEIRPAGKYDGATGYSNTFANFACDVNGNGRMDIVSANEKGVHLFIQEPPAGALLFDGKTFDGWEGNMDWFRIEDGAIVGGSLERRIPRNEFLCTTTEYSDTETHLCS
jgi:hypothetical protein